MSNNRNTPLTRRRVSRKKRQQMIRRRRIILTAVMLIMMVLVVIGVVAMVKTISGHNNKQTEPDVTVSSSSNIPVDGDINSSTAANDNTLQQTRQYTQQQTAGSTEQSVAGQDGTKQAGSDGNAGSAENADSTFTTSKGFKGYVKDGVTYIDGYMIVNKTYSLPSNYIPQDTEVPVTSEWSTKSLNKELMEAYRQLQSAASSNGLNIYISSGYRSYNTQKNLYNNYVAKDGKAQADKYSARAGYSEHQTGLCFDLNTIDDSFQYTDEGIWVNQNAYKYGFIIRYPKGKESITGYQYESWHLRYVGRELAEKLYNNGNWITMEEYFGIDSKYAD